MFGGLLFTSWGGVGDWGFRVWGFGLHGLTCWFKGSGLAGVGTGDGLWGGQGVVFTIEVWGLTFFLIVAGRRIHTSGLGVSTLLAGAWKESSRTRSSTLDRPETHGQAPRSAFQIPKV